MPAKSAGNIRQRFKIKGHEWRVKYVRNLHDPEHGPCLGLVDPDNKVIQLEWLQSPESKWRTFIHELFHAIEVELHISLDSSTSEVLAEGAMDVILSLFTIDWRGSRKRGPSKKPELKMPKLTVDKVENV